MSCCGQKRIALIQGRTGDPGHASAPLARLAVLRQRVGASTGEVMLRYTGVGSFATRSVRSHGSASWTSSRQVRRRSMSIMSARIETRDDRLKE